MLGAVMAWQQNGGLPLRSKTLTLAGVDVLLLPGQSGSAYAVPIESVQVDEAGPGGVSTMTFTIEDPAGAAPRPGPMDEVIFWDTVRDLPIFGGYIDEWHRKPWNTGQIINVTCSGYEILLDWAILPADLTIVTPTKLYTAIQICATAAIGAPNLRAFGGASFLSSQALPIADFSVYGSPAVLAYTITIPGGTSLREAIRLCGQASAATVYSSGSYLGQIPFSPQITIDFYHGLRAMQPGQFLGSVWSEYATLSVNDVPGTSAASNLDHTTDATAIVRGVFVHGLNAAGTGLLTDGTRLPGRFAFIDDQTIDTAAKLLDLQTSYLGQYLISVRGSFAYEDNTPPGNVHPTSVLGITDAQLGLSGGTDVFRVMAISKTFNPSNRENWVVTYGSPPPSAMSQLRHLTRAVRA